MSDFSPAVQTTILLFSQSSTASSYIIDCDETVIESLDNDSPTMKNSVAKARKRLEGLYAQHKEKQCEGWKRHCDQTVNDTCDDGNSNGSGSIKATKVPISTPPRFEKLYEQGKDKRLGYSRRRWHSDLSHDDPLDGSSTNSSDLPLASRGSTKNSKNVVKPRLLLLYEQGKKKQRAEWKRHCDLRNAKKYVYEKKASSRKSKSYGSNNRTSLEQRRIPSHQSKVSRAPAVEEKMKTLMKAKVLPETYQSMSFGTSNMKSTFVSTNSHSQARKLEANCEESCLPVEIIILPNELQKLTGMDDVSVCSTESISKQSSSSRTNLDSNNPKWEEGSGNEKVCDGGVALEDLLCISFDWDFFQKQ